MATQAVVVHGGEVSRWEDQEMILTLKETVCKGATDSQFRMFVEVCKNTGLNPLLKEIWFVPSVGVMAGRDGYLRVANEHPQFDGMETRVERDSKNVPVKATCTVWRKDRNHPIVCEAYYSEYKKGGNVWSTYPSAMISKVAEVLALKRSFSINGVVSEEEIGDYQTAPAQPQTISGPQLAPAATVAPEKPWTTLRGMWECFAAIRSAMNQPDYKQCLEMYGVNDAKDFKDPLKAVECYKAMREWIERKEVA